MRKLIKPQWLPAEYPRWLHDAVAGAIVAGTLYLAAQMAGCALLGQGFFTPLRMFAAIPLGAQALRPDFSPAAVIVVALVTNYLFSFGFTLLFTLLIATVAGMEKEFITFSAVLLGAAVWILNFYILAPSFDWLWFERLNPIHQLIAHALFFGGGLALVFDNDVAHHKTEDTFVDEPAARETV